MGTTTVCVVSDMHINSTIGLCKPSVNLDDGGTYRASPTQRHLWRCWLDYWEQVSKLPGKKVAIVNGDMGELDTKRRTTQIITPNKATIISLVLDCLEPMLDVVGAVVVVRGTQAHTGKGAWLEETIANDIDCTVRCGNGSDTPASFYHFQRQVEGVRFDVCHHVSMGGLPWTEKNAAIKVASVLTARYNEKGMRIPNVAVRSHRHVYADSGKNFWKFDHMSVCSPCFQGVTEYVYRINQENKEADVGGLAFVCKDGEYEYKPYFYEWPKARRVWKKI